MRVKSKRGWYYRISLLERPTVLFPLGPEGGGGAVLLGGVLLGEDCSIFQT